MTLERTAAGRDGDVRPCGRLVGAGLLAGCLALAGCLSVSPRSPSTRDGVPLEPVVLRLTDALGTNAAVLSVYLNLGGDRAVSGFARVPAWNKAVHDVDPSGLTRNGGVLRGVLRVVLRPDAWTPRDGRPVRLEVHLQADLASGAGTYAGARAGDAIQGVLRVRRLDDGAARGFGGEVDLLLHEATGDDKEWRRVVGVTLRPRPGAAPSGKVTTELHRRGSVLLDADQAEMALGNGRFRSSFRFTVPAAGTGTSARVHAYRMEGVAVGGEVAGNHRWSAEGGRGRRAGFFHGTAHESERPLREYVYKTAGGLDLRALVNTPPGWAPGDRRPALVLFSGGALRTGSLNQFRPHAAYFAQRGMVVIRADYRVLSEGRTLANIMHDPRSAVRWVRSHAGELGVDPNRIVVGGASSGGHVALGAELFDGQDDPADDAIVSTRALALVLVSSVVEVTGQWTGGDEDLARSLCPLRHLRRGMPPMFLSVSDTEGFYKPTRAFVAKAREMGARADLFVEEGGHHTSALVSPGMEKLCARLDTFLASLGCLSGPPAIEFEGRPLRPE